MNVRVVLSAAVVALGIGTFAMADVTGKATFEGKAPARKKIPLQAVPACAAAHPNGLEEETVIVGKDGGLANVVISIKNPPAGAKAQNEPAVIDQKGCQYHPHVVAVQTGQKVNVKNGDPFLHNIHGLPEENPGFNFGQNNVDRTGKDVPFKAPEYFRVKCDVHPWMSAWIAVVDSPFYAVTGEDGTFTIKGLPDGTYDVTAWQEKLGQQDGKVTVKGGKGEVNFKFKPEEANAAPLKLEKTVTVSAQGETCCEECEKGTTAAVAKK